MNPFVSRVWMDLKGWDHLINIIKRPTDELIKQNQHENNRPDQTYCAHVSIWACIVHDYAYVDIYCMCDRVCVWLEVWTQHVSMDLRSESTQKLFSVHIFVVVWDVGDQKLICTLDLYSSLLNTLWSWLLHYHIFSSTDHYRCGQSNLPLYIVVWMGNWQIICFDRGAI